MDDMSGLYPEEQSIGDLGKFIGHGINLMNAKGPYMDELRRPVLKINKVADELVKTSPVLEGNVHSQSSDSMSSIYSKWTINASTDIKTPFFSGSFKAEYSNSGLYNQCNVFFKGIVRIKGYSHVLSPLEKSDTKGDALVNYLVKNNYVDEVALLNIRKSMEPARIFSDYGTHVILGGISGGCIQITSQYSSNESVTEEKFNATLKFSCGFATGESSGGFTEEHKSIMKKTELKANSRGGDPRIIGALTKYEEIPNTFKKWSESVSSENYVMTDITIAIPIWEFCDDELRRQSLIDMYRLTSNEQFKAIEAYFPSPKPEEDVVVYAAHNRSYRITKDASNFALLTTEEPLVLVKELVYEGTGLYRFRLKNATTENAYLCVTSKGPSGDFVNLAFTGTKESQYVNFHLESSSTSSKNTYYFNAVKTACYVSSNGKYLVAYDRNVQRALSFTVFSIDN